jgi:NAD(P)-dependent dehydrogenase (short-subunit alcohol dehydrogenase family)
MRRFHEQIAAITGGASGIGFATARALVAEGADVVLAGRDAGRGEQAVAEIERSGGRARFVRTDVADDGQVAALAQQAAQERGRIDIWFNNAGAEGRIGPLTEFDDATVTMLLDTNVKGVYSGMRYALEHMTGGGVIVNNASFVGTKVPVPIAVAYGATKAAVVSMTRAVAAGLGEDGVCVFAVCPWIVDTPMVDRLTGGGAPEDKASCAQAFAPSGRLTPPEEIAGVVLGLCNGSDTARSGDALLVDAGPTITAL